jgi:hypothetical protein
MTLARNKDQALRYEQTFNVLNLEDKLRGLEDKPGYPTTNKVNLGREDVSKTNTTYNIISNQDFSDHHYLPPGQRPPRKLEARPKTQTISALEYKDYDMIAHRYLRDHENKTKYDQDYYKAEAAQKYWNTHDFDPIVGSFIDPDKEQEYCQARDSEAASHGLDKVERLPKSTKYSEGALFNPINCRVVDAGRLEEIDLKHRSAKLRYGARHGFEKECRGKDFEVQDNEFAKTVSKVNHRRFTEHRDRGYNIVTLGPFDGRFAEKLHDPYTKPRDSLWQRALSEARPAPEDSVVPRTRPVEGKTRPPTHGLPAHSLPTSVHAESRGSRAALGSSYSNKASRPQSEIAYFNDGQVITSVREVATPPAPRLRSSGFKRD